MYQAPTGYYPVCRLIAFESSTQSWATTKSQSGRAMWLTLLRRNQGKAGIQIGSSPQTLLFLSFFSLLPFLSSYYLSAICFLFSPSLPFPSPLYDNLCRYTDMKLHNLIFTAHSLKILICFHYSIKSPMLN